MKGKTRIRFNPVTKEIEVEGSEAFVKAYFDKLQAIIEESSMEPAAEPKRANARPAKEAAKAPKAPTARQRKKAGKATRKRAGAKRATHIDTVVALIQGSAEGISTAELKEKAGLSESQIWNIVNRATKVGKIKKIKRGVYIGGEAGQA
jgi:uncharacterized membrane protein